YLEQLAAPPRNAGLVKSGRGAYGGYVLAKVPHEITAGDIICVLEGPITPAEGIEEEEAAQQAVWVQIRDVVNDVLDTTTLEDLIQNGDEEQQKEYMFYI